MQIRGGIQNVASMCVDVEWYMSHKRTIIMSLYGRLDIAMLLARNIRGAAYRLRAAAESMGCCVISIVQLTTTS